MLFYSVACMRATPAEAVATGSTSVLSITVISAPLQSNMTYIEKWDGIASEKEMVFIYMAHILISTYGWEFHCTKFESEVSRVRESS